jgi:hypothetical protein
MSAVRPWSAPSSYAAFRGASWAKSLARRVIDTTVSIAPSLIFRLAAYVTSLERARAVRQQRMTLQQADAPIASLGVLLAKSEPALDHVAVLKLLRSAGELTEAAYHRYLLTAFDARRLDVFEHALSGGGLGFPDTDLFHALRLQQYRGEITMSKTDIAAAFERLSRHKIHRDLAPNVIADALARLGETETLTCFLESLSPEQLSRLAAPTFFGCMRLIATGNATRIDWLCRAYLDSLAVEQQLYFLEVLSAREQAKRIGAPPTPQSVLRRFAEVYSATDAQDHAAFERCVLAPLQRLPAPPTSYLNIRFDAHQRGALLDRLGVALAAGQGFALVRLGDGEAYGYDHAGLDIASDGDFRDDNLTRERMWWGRTVPAAARAALKQRFRAAVADADAIGVPSVYRMIRDRGTERSRFGSTGGQRGLAVVLAKLGTDIPITGRILTEERCHQILFTRETLEALSARARRVVLVSCWRADQVALRTNTLVDEIVIPAHTKVVKATGRDSAAPALFETFDAQIAAMEAACGPGVLVLVGAGFLGKIFIAAARAKGAVALDVGAVLDYLAGYKTRSLADLG